MASCFPGDFQVIHDPEPSSVCVDIVAVHAIGTTRRPWEETAADEMRLKDLLRVEVPSARIMEYVYDLQVIINNGVDEAVSSLLCKLGNNRQKGSERPLVFVCHSLGGIIVQKALLRAQMDSNHTRLRWATIGVVFIRTPHSGHPDSEYKTLGGGRPGGHSLVADKAYHRQASKTFAKINYHFRLIAASLRVIRICIDDCKVNCINNPGEWSFGPDPNQAVHHLERNSCTLDNNGSVDDTLDNNSSVDDTLHNNGSVDDILDNNGSVDDTVRLVGNSIAQIVDGLYKDDIKKAALSSFEMYHSRHPETCKWLLKRPEFDKWLKCRDLPLLWVHGRPGSGKTTLTSYVVEYLEATKSQNEIQVAYFFTRGMAADPLKELLASILRQLLERTSYGYNKAQLYKVLASIDRSSPSLSSWRFGRHLRTVLGSLDMTDTLTLVIDGFDELGGLSNQIANEIVQLSFMVKESRHFKCLITSRSDCSSQLADDHLSRVNLDENYSVRQDISLVVQEKCAEFCARFPSHRKSLQSLASRFSKQPQTSFLWISLMLHDVSRYFCLEKTNLSLSIDHLPSQIGAIYQQRLESISEHHQMLCSRVFLVVAYAARPLRLGELSAALSIPLSGVSDAELVVSEDFLLNHCGGLMTINEDRIVNFVHHSIREYLTSEDNRFLVGMYFVDQVQAHRLLAQACLQCLLQRQRLRVTSLDRGHSSSNHSSHGGIFTFESYAVKHWSLHYRTAESQDNYLAGMLQQLVDISVETGRESNQAPVLPQKVTTGVPTSQNKVFRVCAQNGAAILGQICLEMGVDVNTKFCPYGVSALHIAVASGHADMVELLLRKGAAINARTFVQGITALHYACFRGDTSMVKILLNHGALSNVKTTDYEETPLHVAAAGGHLEVIELLLASGAEVNVATSLTKETPLHLAAAYGFVDEASYLLGVRWHGRPDVEKARRSGGPRYPGKQGDEPRLEDRSHLNRNESFDSLLSFGEPDKDFPVDLASNTRSSQSADVGARNRDGWTPLHVAAAWGNLDIVELLLEQGADIDAKTFDGYTALCLAEEYGHQAVMSALCWALQLLADEEDQCGFEIVCQEPYKNDDDAMNSFFQRNYQINSVLLEGHGDWTAIIMNNEKHN